MKRDLEEVKDLGGDLFTLMGEDLTAGGLRDAAKERLGVEISHNTAVYIVGGLRKAKKRAPLELPNLSTLLSEELEESTIKGVAEKLVRMFLGGNYVFNDVRCQDITYPKSQDGRVGSCTIEITCSNLGEEEVE